MWKFYNVFRRFCAFIIGMVFFLSGILKLMDPVGAGLIVAEYYKFLHIGFLAATSQCVATVLAFIETILGVALMAGLWRKVVSIVTFSFLGVFTVITLLLLIFNPVMDCGCFGEAVHLTHLQSFIKNVILLGLSVVAFVPGRLGRPRRRKYVAFGIVSAFVVAFGIYSQLYIPLVDFTDFRPGAKLEAALDTSPESYVSTFVYEKDGVEENFTLETLPDSTWTFVRTETVRTVQSDETVAELSFSDRFGNYVSYLAAYGDVMVISLYKPTHTGVRQWRQVEAAERAARQAGYTAIVLVSTDYETTAKTLTDKFGRGGINFENLYFADYRTILSMNRSNGGATYFKGGTLVTKWARRDLPSKAKLEGFLENDTADSVVETTLRRNLVYEGLIVVAFGVLFFI